MLMHDLLNPASPKNPANRAKYQLDNSLELFRTQVRLRVRVRVRGRVRVRVRVRVRDRVRVRVRVRVGDTEGGGRIGSRRLWQPELQRDRDLLRGRGSG